MSEETKTAENIFINKFAAFLRDQLEKIQRNICFFILLCSLLYLMGCATPYQKLGLTGGYSDTILQTNMFRVSFRGNGYTSLEKCQDMALLRCAEVTLNNHFRFFAIFSANENEDTWIYKTPTTGSSSGFVNTYGNYSSVRTSYNSNGGMYIPIKKPHIIYVIKCFHEKPEGIEVFDASFLMQTIQNKYGLK